MRKSTSGFTIVELLIVIVVVAILAAITVVAYNGIQNRANDAAVQNDIDKLVKQLRLYEAEGGLLPTAGSHLAVAPNSRQLPGITFMPSKSSYDVTSDNLFYCEGLKSGLQTFAITAISKSKKIFVYRPSEGMTSQTSGSAYSICQAGWDAGSNGYSYGYYNGGSAWNWWIN